MIIRSPLVRCLYAIGFSFGSLFLHCENSIAQSATPTLQAPPNLRVVQSTASPVAPPTPVGPPTNNSKAYFEWSYDLPLENNSLSVQRALAISSGNKVFVTCVAVSTSNLPVGETLSGEIRFLSNFGGNLNPLMRVGLPQVIGAGSGLVADAVEMVFFSYWTAATSGTTQEVFNILVNRNNGAGAVDVTVCLFGYTEPI